MKDSKYFVGVLTGVVITLLLVLILSVNQPSPVLAQATGQSGHVTAVSSETKQGDPLVFLVDSQEEVVLAYILWEAKGKLSYPLEFLSARNYKWDKKAESFKNYGPTVKSVRDTIMKKEEISEGEEK